MVPLGLYTEQLSGTAFTRPRHVNRRTWLYRQQPSAVHNPVPFVDTGDYFGGADPTRGILDPNPIRWSPFEDDPAATVEFQPKTFITGMKLLMAAGEPPTKNGLGIYVYLFHNDMHDSYMYNSDGDFLIVPQEGGLVVKTEVGILHVRPKEICVIPRGIVFSINRLLDSSSPTSRSGKPSTYRGYVLEVYKGHFTLPELGPIGSNGLANARDFLYPTAWCEWWSSLEGQSPTTGRQQRRRLYNKFGSKLWYKPIESSPFNVVAWHGNYLPFKYDLSLFCAVNSVTYDHMDPSIYTVLTCVGDETGTALCDFVIFPPRWMSTDPNTFRPPWFHRNSKCH
jgi:homogentisate 1,2-dioxygenase